MKSKKIIAILLVVIVAVGLFSCGGNESLGKPSGGGNETDGKPSGGGGKVAGAPNSFNVVIDDKQATLSWTAPTSNGGAEITKYQVSYANKNAFEWEEEWADNWVDASSNTSHTFTGLTNGLEYTFKVRAVNSAGTGAEAESKATPQTQKYTLHTLDRIILNLEEYSTENSFVKDVKALYGTTVKLYEDSTISFSGSLTSEFGRRSYTVDESGKVKINGLASTFNNSKYEKGFLSLGLSIGDIPYSFSYYNDDIWFEEHPQTYTLSFEDVGDSPIEPVQRKERELLNPPTPSKKGYDFIEWKDNGSQGPMKLGRMPRGSHRLIAKWDFHFTSRRDNLGSGNFVVLTGISDAGSSQTSLYIPDNHNSEPVQVIDASVFKNKTSIENISIGANVQSLNRIDMFKGMTALKSITLRDTSGCTSIGNQILSQIGAEVRFYVPSNLLKAYKSDAAWSAVAERIFAIAE